MLLELLCRNRYETKQQFDTEYLCVKKIRVKGYRCVLHVFDSKYNIKRTSEIYYPRYGVSLLCDIIKCLQCGVGYYD